MAWTAANGSKAAPAHLMQISDVNTNVTSNKVDAGTFVRDVDDNVVYLVTNDWDTANQPVVPFVVGNYLKVITKAVTYEITPTDGIGFLIADGAGITITLPLAAKSKGRRITICAPTGTANAITVEGNGAETINGGANYSINLNFEQSTMVCNGTAWFLATAAP